MDDILADLTLDPNRAVRTGLPEAIYCPGKSLEQLHAAVLGLESGSGPIICTRANQEQMEHLSQAFPEALLEPSCGMVIIGEFPESTLGTIGIVTAGTSDLPVAKECEAASRALGIGAVVLADRGVAGLHRSLDAADQLQGVDVVVVVAGMEGALASVVAGLVTSPVIAVPTSAGYGSSFEGITALLGMISSCSPGITVVGIDNGFGAAAAARRILAIERHT